LKNKKTNFFKLNFLNAYELNELNFKLNGELKIDKLKNTINNSLLNNMQKNIVYSDFIENSRFLKKNNGIRLPFRLLKNNFNQNNDILLLNFNDSNNMIEQKIPNQATYLTIKQKRYKRKKINNKAS